MTRDQKIVAMGAGSGVATMAVAMFLLPRLLSAPTAMTAVGDRLGYALRWDALAALPLFVMVAAVGNARFNSAAIDPTRGAESKKTIVDGRVADNTAQQFLLFLVGTLALAASLPSERLGLVAAAAIVFCVARVLFWIGYRIDPLYRAFGMAATSYLNLGLLAGAIWLGFF